MILDPITTGAAGVIVGMLLTLWAFAVADRFEHSGQKMTRPHRTAELHSEP